MEHLRKLIEDHFDVIINAVKRSVSSDAAGWASSLALQWAEKTEVGAEAYFNKKQSCIEFNTGLAHRFWYCFQALMLVPFFLKNNETIVIPGNPAPSACKEAISALIGKGELDAPLKELLDEFAKGSINNW